MSTGFTAGMRNHRITILNKVAPTEKAFGEKTGYRRDGSLNSSYEFNKGTRALREGSLDAYDTVMFRCRYNKDIDRWCLLQYNGKWYQITSFNEDYHDNQLQMTAVELANQQVNIIEPTPEPTQTPEPSEESAVNP